MTFKNKARLGISVFICLVVVVISGAMMTIFRVKDSESHFNENFARQVVLAERTRNYLEEQFSIVPSFVLNPSRREFERFHTAHANLARALTELRAELSTPEELGLLKEMYEIDQDLYQAATPGMMMRFNGHSIAEVNAYFANTTFQKTLRLRDDMDKMVDLKVTKLEDARVSIKKSFSKLAAIIILSAILLLALCFFIGLLVWKSICQHVREQELRDEVLVQQQRLATARKEVVEVVAHDLKSPLASLLMNLELTKSDLENHQIEFDELSASLDMGIRSANGMKKLIESLLDHAKIESHKLDLSLKLHNGSDLVREQIAQLQLLAPTKQVRVTTELEKENCFLLCDETRASQVLSNLISNAFKFVNVGGEIKIKTSRTKDTFTVSIFNSGAHLSPAEIAHAFERYWQVRKTAHEGTGLGLAIVKGIMLAHKGDVTAESDPATGVTFKVSFPLAEMESRKNSSRLERRNPQDASL